MDVSSQKVTRLTQSPARDYLPAWSPGGTKIVFASNRDGNEDIYVMNADGTNPVNLTNHPSVDGSPSWSPASLGVSPKGKLSTTWGKIKENY